VEGYNIGQNNYHGSPLLETRVSRCSALRALMVNHKVSRDGVVLEQWLQLARVGREV
jgi:hypothetical protein